MLHFSSHTLLIANELFSSGEALKKFLPPTRPLSGLFVATRRRLQCLQPHLRAVIGVAPQRLGVRTACTVIRESGGVKV